MLRASACRAEYDPAEPLLVAGKVGNSLLVTAVDKAAARIGLSAGMTVATARAIHPTLQVIDADDAADRALIESLADWCDRFTPLVALDLPHGLLLDITGCAHLFGDEAAMMQTMTRVLTQQGFGVCAAIAGTAVAARALTRHRHGDIVKAGGEASAVAELSLTTLGADPKTVQGLRRAGLKTIGDAATRASQELAARFGAEFMELLDQARGLSDAPITPRKPVPDYVAEKRFAEPVATADIIATTLQSLAQVLIDAMERQGKGARQLAASIFRTDGIVRTLVVDSGQAMTRVEIVARLFAEKFNALNDPIDPGFGFDLIRLCATRTVDVVPAQRGFDTNAHEAADVTELADRLAARLGARRVLRYVSQDTHIPERAALAVPLLHLPPTGSDAAWPQRNEAEPPLRPLRLFDPPESIEVTAMFPDGPPAQFEWRKMQHRLTRVEGPERIAAEWWRMTFGAVLSEEQYAREAHTRDYFRVESKDGCRFWLYRRGIYKREVHEFRWFVHGIFA